MQRPIAARWQTTPDGPQDRVSRSETPVGGADSPGWEPRRVRSRRRDPTTRIRRGMPLRSQRIALPRLPGARSTIARARGRNSGRQGFASAGACRRASRRRLERSGWRTPEHIDEDLNARRHCDSSLLGRADSRAGRWQIWKRCRACFTKLREEVGRGFRSSRPVLSSVAARVLRPSTRARLWL